MPPLRHPSTTRSLAPGPYKASIIVISSDEDEEPIPTVERGHRKHRRSRPEGEVLEIVDDTSVKLEEPETESLRRRCDKLEQERDMLQKENRHLSATLNQLKASTKQNTLDMSALDDAVCCEVCTHTMWLPYLCGHTFCQGCLTDWFNTILLHHRQISGRGPPPYTCPSCRLAVRTPPVQNYSLKRIVRLAAESRGESSPRRPQAPPLPAVQPLRGRGGVRRDHHPSPFDGFFRR